MYNGATDAVKKWLAAEPEKPAAPKPTEPATTVTGTKDTAPHAAGIKVPVADTPVPAPAAKPAPAPGQPTNTTAQG